VVVTPPHNHTYGKKLPADGTGVTTTLAWELPDGWKAEELPWPEPHEVPSTGGEKSLGYDETVYLPAKITPAGAAGTAAEIVVKVRGLVCDPESCMPFKTEAKTCFAESVGFRAKVFCHGCWAFGGSNFVKNGDGTIAPNFKMTPNSCNNLVTKCGKAWKFFYDTLVAMNLVSQVAKKKFNLSSAPANDASTLSNKVTVTPVLLHAAFDRRQLTSFAVRND